jgi:hypothetical protein
MDRKNQNQDYAFTLPANEVRVGLDITTTDYTGYAIPPINPPITAAETP